MIVTIESQAGWFSQYFNGPIKNLRGTEIESKSKDKHNSDGKSDNIPSPQRHPENRNAKLKKGKKNTT